MRREKISQFQPVIFRSGVTSIVSIRKTSASMPVVRMAKFTRVGAELMVHCVPRQQRQRHAAVDEHEQLGEADVVVFHGVARSEIRAQIHAGV